MNYYKVSVLFPDGQLFIDDGKTIASLFNDDTLAEKFMELINDDSLHHHLDARGTIEVILKTILPMMDINFIKDTDIDTHYILNICFDSEKEKDKFVMRNKLRGIEFIE